jgi:hypothetical protein
LREATKELGQWEQQKLFTDPQAGYERLNQFLLSTSQVVHTEAKPVPAVHQSGSILYTEAKPVPAVHQSGSILYTEAKPVPAVHQSGSILYTEAKP